MPGLVCWNCGYDTGIEGGVMRTDHCERCESDLRCCRGCRHFDPRRRFQCRESIARSIPRKDKANFCDFYQKRLSGKAAMGGYEARDEKKSRFDDLFED